MPQFNYSQQAQAPELSPLPEYTENISDGKSHEISDKKDARLATLQGRPAEEKKRLKNSDRTSEYFDKRLNTGDSPYDFFFGKGISVKSSLSKITVENGTDQDAVVIFKEVISKKIARNIYIRAGNNYTAKEFPEGIYEMKCYYGNGWNSELNNGSGNPTGGFVHNVSCSTTTHSSDYFDMRKEKTYNGINYPTYTVTLHKVRNGNMQTKNIPKGDFFN